MIYASVRGQTAMVQHLLEKGAQLNAQDKNGFSGLILAAADRVT